ARHLAWRREDHSRLRESEWHGRSRGAHRGRARPGGTILVGRATRRRGGSRVVVRRTIAREPACRDPCEYQRHASNGGHHRRGHGRAGGHGPWYERAGPPSALHLGFERLYGCQRHPGWDRERTEGGRSLGERDR